MRATIRDQETLRSIRPLELFSYLRNQGWHHVAELDDRSALWERQGAAAQEDPEEVTLPLRQDLGDFALRVSEVLRVLERVEQRSQVEILSDLMTSSSDLIRLRAFSADHGTSSIPLEHGVVFVEKARELVLAAACAAIDPRAYFATRKPAQANEYLGRVRMGQTERGSFVLTILSPVPPALRAADPNATIPVEPFERRVISTLAQALNAARTAAQRAAVTGDLQPFREAIQLGVSANFCDALAGLGEVSAADGVEVAISWSRSRPLANFIPGRVRFSPDMVPILQEASRVFKETEPREAFEIRGFVIDLHRDEGSPVGRVVVSGLIDGDVRKVAIDLSEPEYSIALEAHRDERRMRCVGDLVKHGRSYRLLNARNLALVTAEEE